MSCLNHQGSLLFRDKKFLFFIFLCVVFVSMFWIIFFISLRRSKHVFKLSFTSTITACISKESLNFPENSKNQKQRDIFKYVQIMWHLLRDYKFQQPVWVFCMIYFIFLICEIDNFSIMSIGYMRKQQHSEVK